MIDIGKCISEINVEKIQKNNYANVYVMADKDCMKLSFAYSVEKGNEITLAETTTAERALTEDLWQEFLYCAKFISCHLGVQLFVDDIRTCETTVL